MRRIVSRFVPRGNTINLCSIDLTKAFDKVNHHGLYEVDEETLTSSASSFN